MASVPLAVALRLYPPSKRATEGAMDVSIDVMCAKPSGVTRHLQDSNDQLRLLTAMSLNVNVR